MVVVHFGKPRQYFQVLSMVGEGRFNVALRVIPLRNALSGRIDQGELVLKFAKNETGDKNSALRVEARNVSVFQRAQLDCPYERPNVARLVFDFTGARPIGDLLAPGDLSCTLWRFYSVGNLRTLCTALQQYGAKFPAYFGPRLFAEVLEAVYAMHMEQGEFAITHRDKGSVNIFIDYPETGDPRFLLGDFYEGAILREPAGSKARYDALQESIGNVRQRIVPVPSSHAHDGEGHYWEQIREQLGLLTYTAARAPQRPGERGWNDMGRAMSHAIVSLQAVWRAILFGSLVTYR